MAALGLPSGGLSRPRWRLGHGLVLLAAVSPLGISPTNLALALSAVLFFLDREARLRPTPLDDAAFAWLAVTIVATVASIDPVASMTDLKGQLHWAVFWLVAAWIAGGGNLERMQNVWLMSASVAALAGILQATVGFDPLGRGSEKPEGFFRGHLVFGHYVLMVLGVAVARYAASRSARERAWTGTILVLVLGGIAASFGRGVWLAVPFVLLGWILWEPDSVSRRRLLASGAVVAVLLGGTHFWWIAGGSLDFYRSYVVVESAGAGLENREQIFSNVYRLTMWREGLRVYAQRPILGTGPDTIGDLSRDFRTPFEDFGVAHLHSNYVNVLVSRGFLGLAALLFVFLRSTAVLAARREAAASAEDRAALFGGVAAILAHVVHGFTYVSFDKAALRPGFLLVLGMAAGVAMRGRTMPLPGVAPFAWGAVTLALLLVFEPWASAAPVFVLGGAVLALTDAACLAFRSRLDPAGLALVLAFLVAALAVTVFLGMEPGRGAAAFRSLGAAAWPFLGSWLGMRSWQLAGRWV